ncbi:hypothetical protein PRZ48_009316 [Zasmidium cellare]|uniref:Rhodanese domain-containing protein n=1 Tax=Zasmidium cellare TaxID=395010 RepID=A0ABR0EC19_ZASCE|nr:hypothetical protein PRZ48_009316 [Zasmidium cellare]
MSTSQPNANPAAQNEEPPWHASFPPPTLHPQTFPARRALVLQTLKIASLLIIDVRRTDYTGGCIRGSLNIPAQGFYWNRGALYELAYKADMEWVVFVLEGGVRGWVGGGEEFRGFMDGFDEGVWGDVLKEEVERKKIEGEKVETQDGTVEPNPESSERPADGTTEVKEKVWSFEKFLDD